MAFAQINVSTVGLASHCHKAGFRGIGEQLQQVNERHFAERAAKGRCRSNVWAGGLHHGVEGLLGAFPPILGLLIHGAGGYHMKCALSNPQVVACFQRRPLNPLSVDKSSVFRLQILGHQLAVLHVNPRVLARSQVVVYANISLPAAPYYQRLIGRHRMLNASQWAGERQKAKNHCFGVWTALYRFLWRLFGCRFFSSSPASSRLHAIIPFPLPNMCRCRLH